MAEPKASLFSLRASGIIGGKRRGVPRRITPEEPPPPPPPVVLGIFGDIIADLEFDEQSASYPKIIQISGTIYAIVYSGLGEDGWIITVDIAADGAIGDPIIDSLEFDTGRGAYPSIVHVSGSVFAIAYSGAGEVGKMLTVNIDSSGNIGAAAIDTLTFDAGRGNVPKLFHVSGTTFGIAYQGFANDGFVVTMDIQDNGQIGAGIIDSLEFDIESCNFPDVIAVGGNFFAIAYQGGAINNYIWVKTVEINGAGNITAPVTDSLEVQAALSAYARIINISGSTYAITYATANKGQVDTVDIDSAGNIGAAVIDSWEWESTLGVSPAIMLVAQSVFCIAFTGPGADGWLITLNLAADGTITESIIDSLEFEPVICNQGLDIIHIEGDTFAVAYKGVDGDGWLKTFPITTG